jgi:hypothetical protein
MGQYWIPVNLDKRQFLEPHKLGSGLKLWEQLAQGGTGQALILLMAAMPERRGGGDLGEHKIVGSWAGDRVTFIGDYAEDGDLTATNPGFTSKSTDTPESKLFGMCRGRDEEGEGTPFEDITDEVCAVIEKELGGVFCGSGWREFHDNGTPEALKELKERKTKAKQAKTATATATATMEAPVESTLSSITLSNQEGTSDKLYRLTLIQNPDATFSAKAESCRRGKDWINQGMKADHVDIHSANATMQKIKNEKIKKGYLE